MDDGTDTTRATHRGVSRRTILAGIAAGGLAMRASDAGPAHATPDTGGGVGTEVLIGDFETGMDGWTAISGGPSGTSVDYRFERSKSRAKIGSYSAHLWADFHGGYNARATRSLDDLGLDQLPRPELDAVSFWVYADNVDALFLWIVDATNQIHQQTLPVTSGSWVPVRVTTFDAGQDYKTFGGADDGRWHGPAKRVHLLIPTAHRADHRRPGQMWLDHVMAEMKPASSLSLTQTALGNVFTDPGGVAFALTASSGTAALTARDLWGNVLDKKSVSVRGVQRIQVRVGSPGYFELDVKSTSRPGDDLQTPFAVLAGPERPEAGSSAFGVGAHFGFATWGTQMMPLVALSGVSEIRDSIPWSKVEKATGQYVFGYGDAFMDDVNAEGMSPLINLHGPNRNYDNGLTPYTPDAIAAYAAYGQQLLRHYGRELKWIEVWNEYNGGFSDGPGAQSVTNYVKILQAAYQGVKKVRSDVTVVAPATAGVPMNWLEGLFELGGLDYLDAVSMHPYRWPVPPESLAHQMGEVEALIKHYAGRSKPIWITEIGWPTGGPFGTNEREQAEYLARTFALALSAGVQKIFWYDFMNNGIDQTDKHDNFGIIRYATDPLGRYTPKPAYVAYSVLTRQLDGKEYLKEDDSLPDGVRSHVFRDSAGVHTRVMWSPGQRQEVALSVGGGRIDITDLMGRTATYEPSDRSIYVSLGNDPVYVTGDVHAVVAGAAVGLSAAPTAAVGDDVPVTLTVDASASSLPVPALFDVVGRPRPVSVHAAGGRCAQRTITVPGLDGLGLRTVIADVRLRGRRAARLAADVEVRPAVTVRVTPDVTVDPLKAALVVEVVNNSVSITRTVDAISWTVGDATSIAKPGTSLSPGTSRRVRIPLSGRSSWTPYDASVTVDVSGLEPFHWQNQVTFDPVLARTITVDGTLDDAVANSPGIDLSRDGQWKQSKSSQQPYGGPSDAGGQMWLFHDQDSLFLVAKITDNVFSQTNTGSLTWRGDSIQFAMVSGPPVNTGQTAHRYELALTPDGPQLNRDLAPAGVDLGLVTDADVAITRRGTTAVYEAAIPWAQTPLDASTGLFAFTVLYNDNDGNGRKGYLQWGSGLGSGHVDPSEFNACQLIT